MSRTLKPWIASAMAIIWLAGCTALQNSLHLPNPSAAAPAIGAIQAGDILDISVTASALAVGKRQVSDEGRISDINGLSVKVAGLDMAQAADRIAHALHKSDPAASVTVKVINPKPIYVLGEVNRAGAYSFEAGQSLSQLVFRAGGYSHRADVTRAFVDRPGEGKAIAVSQDDTFVFAPGDIVRIPQKYF